MKQSTGLGVSRFVYRTTKDWYFISLTLANGAEWAGLDSAVQTYLEVIFGESLRSLRRALSLPLLQSTSEVKCTDSN